MWARAQPLRFRIWKLLRDGPSTASRLARRLGESRGSGRTLVSVAAAVTVAGCGGGDATLATFAGTWQGHGHTLKITRHGLAEETIDSGCCHLALAVEFRLSNPHGTARTATATATVTAVRTGDESAFTNAIPKPRVGESRTVRLREGVITETLTGTRYCSPTAKHWVCGA